MKKIMRVVVKIAIILFLVVAVLLLAARLAAPPLAVSIANKKLPAILGTEASIGKLKLRLYRGYVSFCDLKIAQPEGYGGGVLLSVPEFYLKIKPSSLFSHPLTVEEIVLNDAEINLIKNKEGVLNLEAVIPESESAPEAESEPEEEEGAPPPRILLARAAVSNLSFSYTDYSIKEEKEDDAAPPAEASGEEEAETELAEAASETDAGEGEEGEILRVRLAEFNLLVTDLRVGSPEELSGYPPATARVDMVVVQEPFPPAPFALAARIGPVGGGILPLNAVLRLGGLELKPLAAVIPPGTVQMLGGDALDLGVNLALSPEVLDCFLEVEASGGHKLSLPVGGTPADPVVDSSGVLFTLLLHAGGGVGALAGNIGGAGVEVVGSAVKTTAAVGEGAARMVGSVGGGLFKTVTSAATGDLKGAAGGLSDATVGTLGEAGRTVGSAAGELGRGAAAAAGAAAGKDADKAWKEAVRDRWANDWKEALSLLERMPFPPPPAETAEKEE